MVPALIALDPAEVSSKCARLEDDINAICGQDPDFTRGINFLKHVQSMNRQQGLGLTVFGVVCTKRTLGIAASSAYGLIVLLWPVLVREPEQDDSAGCNCNCNCSWPGILSNVTG